MGVLKVNVGTALAPDWRNVGCGGAPSTHSVIADTFNRADSTSTLNPASDGGTWTIDSGSWGISSNRGYVSNTAGGGGVIRTGVGGATIATDHGSSTVDLTVTNYRANTAGFSEIVFSNSGHRSATDSLLLRYDSGGSTSTIVYSAIGGALTTLGSVALTAWTGGSTVIRITYDPSTGVVNVYQGGTFRTTVTVPVAQRTTGTVVAFGSQTNAAGEFWDDFTINGTAVTTGAVGRLKLWDGTRWIREKCTDDHGTVLLSDDFTRANSTTTPGGAWNVMAQTNGYEGVDVYGGTAVAGISSNAGYVVSRRADFTIGQSLYTIVTQDFGTADVDISLTIVDNGTCGIMARVTDGSSGMLVAPSAGVIVGLDGSTLTTFSPTSAGDVLRLICSGTTCTLYKNGTLVVTFSNSYTGTRHGWGGGANFKVDNFTISTVLIPRPLKVWDGSAWQTVACMVPA